MTVPVVLPPLDAWIAIKTVLRNKLGEDAWSMWIMHCRLMRTTSPKRPYKTALLVSIPRNSAAISGAQRNTPKIRKLARKLNYDLSLCVQPIDSNGEKALKERGVHLTYLEPAPSDLWGKL